MMNSSDYGRLLKLIKLMKSHSDGEALNAVSAINRMLDKYGLTWDELILPRKLLPVRSRQIDPELPPERPSKPVPLSQATPQDMYDALLDSVNISPSLRRDIMAYRSAIESGRVTTEIRADLRSLYNHVILHGKHM
jgi:hypothetical protein